MSNDSANVTVPENDTIVSQKPGDTGLRDVVRERKAEKKQIEAKKIEEALAKKPEIMRRLNAGQHWYPDAEDPSSVWLAGRGGKGVKTDDGRIVKVALVGLYPGRHEIHNKPSPAVMVGPSGRFLDGLLKYQVPLDAPYRTNLIKYFKKPKTKITAAEKAIGKAILFEELASKGIEYVICLGAEVYDVLAGDKKRFPASRFRGIFLPPSRAVIPVHLSGLQNPAYIMSPEGEKEATNFEDNLTSLFDYIKTGRRQERAAPAFTPIDSIKGAFAWMRTFEDYVRSQHEQGEKVILSIDTEGKAETVNGTLEPTEITLIPVSYGNKKATQPEELAHALFTLQRCPDWEYTDGKTALKTDDELIDLFTLSAGDRAPEEDPFALAPEADGTPNDEDEDPKAPKRVNFVVDPTSPDYPKIQRKIDLNISAGALVAVLDRTRIQRTELDTTQGRLATRFTLTKAIELADEVVMQHSHYDKRALELIGFNWDSLAFTTTGEDKTVSSKLRELMIETLTLDETENRGLKEVCAKTLGWKGYDIPLELFKAEHDINDYSLIPYSQIAPYAILDSAGTLLAVLKKERMRKKKWETNESYIRKYYDDLAEITGSRHSDPAVQTPEVLTVALNKLMMPLYRAKKNGMPVGKEGLAKVREMVDFYETHYQRLRQRIAEESKALLGRELTDPGSIDQVNFVLYAPKAVGGLELEPFKEPGKSGRLWSRLSVEERTAAKGSGAIDGESFGILASRLPDGQPGSYEARIKTFVRELGECRNIKSIRDNFFADPEDSEKGFFSRIGKDGYLHTEYMPTTETLRFRSQPNLANPPKGEKKWVGAILSPKGPDGKVIESQQISPPWELRNAVTAADGHTLFIRDWSSAEVYMLMYRANDAAGLDVIAKGLDFHITIGLNADRDIKAGHQLWLNKSPELIPLITAFAVGSVKDPVKDLEKIKKIEAGLMKLFQSTKEKDGHSLLKKIFSAQRDNIKPVTFGVPYGQTAEALALKTGMEVVTAEEYIAGYHATYPGASKFLEYNGRFAMDYRMLPQPWGYLRNFSSRQRDDEIQRQAFNLPLQHGVACLMNQALVDWEEAKERYRLKTEVFLSLYDAIGWHVPDDEAKTVAEISHEIMSVKRPVGPLDSRTIPTEGKFMKYWEGPKDDRFFWPDLNLV